MKLKQTKSFVDLCRLNKNFKLFVFTFRLSKLNIYVYKVYF